MCERCTNKRLCPGCLADKFMSELSPEFGVTYTSKHMLWQQVVTLIERDRTLREDDVRAALAEKIFIAMSAGSWASDDAPEPSAGKAFQYASDFLDATNQKDEK